MVKPNYNVENGDQKSNNKQTSITGQSYKSFICVMLVFLLVFNIENTASTTTANLEIISTTTIPNENKTLNKWITSEIFYPVNFMGNPCSNFYDYACGRNDIKFKDQSKNMHILSTKLSNKSNLKKGFEYMKTFYDSCVDYEKDFDFKKRIENVEKLTKEIGNFMFIDDSNVTSFKLTELFQKLTIRQSNPLFDIGLELGEKSNIILQITLPEGTALRNGLKTWSSFAYHKKQCLQMENMKSHQSNPDLNDIYESYRKCSNDLTPYLNSIENVISYFDFGNLSPENKLAKIKGIRSSVENFLNVLNEEMPLSPHEIQVEYEEKKYKSVKIGKLNSDIIEWDFFFKNITGNADFNFDTKIHVYFMDYFQKMFGFLFPKWSPSKLNNALLAIYANDLFINTAILGETDRRDQFCSDLSKQLLPIVWSDLVYQETLLNKNKYYNLKTVQTLFDQLKEMLINAIETDISVNWVYASFTDMVKKIKGLEIALFPFDEISNNFNGLEIGPDFQTNLIQLLSLLRYNIYSLAGAPLSNKNHFSYFLDPLSTKPQSFYHSNIIAVPMGLLKKGIDGDMPNYVTLARVGFQIAREIFRHFDLNGKSINIDNEEEALNVYHELQEKTIEKIEESVRVFESTNSISINLDSTVLPVNEVIRTDAAFRLISDLFKQDEIQISYLPLILEQNTKEQFFHLIAAQEFCAKQEIGELAVNLLEKMQLPEELIVNNFVFCSEKFSTTFDCGIGSNMNPHMITKLQFPYLSELDEQNIS